VFVCEREKEREKSERSATSEINKKRREREDFSNASLTRGERGGEIFPSVSIFALF